MDELYLLQSLCSKDVFPYTMLEAQKGICPFVLSKLLFYFDAMPEGDIACNILCCLFGGWVIPGGIFIDLVIDLYIVVTREALPGTGRMRSAFFEVCAVDRVRWEILVAFHNFTLITFGECHIIPGCLWHERTPLSNLVVFLFEGISLCARLQSATRILDEA